jgi:hypothetical protein
MLSFFTSPHMGEVAAQRRVRGVFSGILFKLSFAKSTPHPAFGHLLPQGEKVKKLKLTPLIVHAPSNLVFPAQAGKANKYKKWMGREYLMCVLRRLRRTHLLN